VAPFNHQRAALKTLLLRRLPCQGLAMGRRSIPVLRKAVEEKQL
jgi:hypothetical protein